MKYAPVFIPTLCRSSHFIRLVESLKRNSWAKYTDIYIGLDFPPTERHRKGWEEICNYVDNGDFSAFASFSVIKHKKNIGAARNDGFLLDYVLEKYDRFIRFDDDNEASPNFLEYANKCLEKYEDDDDVIAVCGYSYPINWKVSKDATVLKQNINAAVWGVGFWKRKHLIYSSYLSSSQMLNDVSNVIKTKAYKKMLDVTKIEYFTAACFTLNIGKNRYWLKCASDIGLRAYLAVKGKYAISPVVSKVRNHGFDGSGLGCQSIDNILQGNTAGTYNYQSQKIDVREDFVIIEDTLQADAENRSILNNFDFRSKQEMRKTMRTIFLCEHIGIWAAKLYRNLEFPFYLVTKISKRIRI